MVFYMSPPAIIEEMTLRVSDYVTVVQQKLDRDGTRQDPERSKIVSMHRSLRAKAHDKTSDFENNYPW